MTDLEVLAFARDHRLDATDEDAIRSAFGSPARFYQRLGRAITDPGALEADPELVYRLRRIRDEWRGSRAARRF